MTGPGHYKAAESWLQAAGEAADESLSPEKQHCFRMECLAEAQVHATLALTAATADPFDHQHRWNEATR
jgi:hypothetical protein